MNPEIEIIFPETGGYVAENEAINEHLPPVRLIKTILAAAVKGTPLLKYGNGSPKLMFISGMHGNELPPQIATLQLITELEKFNSAGTLYLLPFAIPFATMKNDRRYDGMDMNRQAHREGSISNVILNKIKKLKINSIADFHSTQKRSSPGVECVFCSKNPTDESLTIANHITKLTSSKVLCHDNAGNLYKGALEDESNLWGIPAVTCEVVSTNGAVDPGSSERSFLQMKAYLDYFNIKI
jgi:predicted deacylase